MGAQILLALASGATKVRWGVRELLFLSAQLPHTQWSHMQCHYCDGMEMVSGLNATDKTTMYKMSLIYTFGFWGLGFGASFFLIGVLGQWHFAIDVLSRDRWKLTVIHANVLNLRQWMSRKIVTNLIAMLPHYFSYLCHHTYGENLSWEPWHISSYFSLWAWVTLKKERVAPYCESESFDKNIVNGILVCLAPLAQGVTPMLAI